MRLWSLHPQYLDAKGLIALWREALLAQAVLAGLTRGYKHHPQLVRFKETERPRSYIASYLQAVLVEASRRSYCFNGEKIGQLGSVEALLVTKGQLNYEWVHLKNKLQFRDPSWLFQFQSVTMPKPHPLFQIVAGPVAKWEAISAQQSTQSGRLNR
ncbi:pyrimidine dimer DNA glycosylase/endonuclease V [Nitrosococcus oceani]|uniref:pyrimidine dimer DNA glycosylase/endonuclease V n=1 Tax=Nitrosococcus oceani TaxID=1229 RepID=UPI0004E96FB6|nr:pyrimidine dimer DNA glycosylase/endonuclease V [Nitrosococcus oceani]KFI21420.1 DNA lyase [Nitrosococcus oceani]